MNNTWHSTSAMGTLGASHIRRCYSNPITTPNGTQADTLDAHSTDLYWFAGAEAPFWRSCSAADLYG